MLHIMSLAKFWCVEKFPCGSLCFVSLIQLSCSCFHFDTCGIGLGQVQLKLGDFRSSLSNFEKVLDVYPENCESLKVSHVSLLWFWFVVGMLWCLYSLLASSDFSIHSFLDKKAVGHIYVQLGQTEKALETLRKATKIDPRDAQVYCFCWLMLWFQLFFFFLRDGRAYSYLLVTDH